MTTPLLQLDGLRAGYGHVEVLHGVSLTVPEGHMVAIVGPNGAGKTTLMGAVMGLLPRRGGTVRYMGEPAGTTEALVASGALLVPEQRALFTDMSVEDNLLLGFYPRRRAGERDARPAMREVFAIFPHLRGTAAPACRDALGWRAADAGTRAGVDGPAAPAAAG